MEAKGIELDNVPFDLAKLVSETTQVFEIQANQKGLSMSCDISPEIPREVMGDAARLRQILVNLLGNALKFTPAGWVSVHATLESSGSHEIQVRFAVTDTGIGIPVEKQGVIFQAFAQADGSMTRKYGGTGLGLSISMRLVELMGGRMGIASEAGKGSTFHFSLRFARPGAERREEVESQSPGKNLAIVISPLS
jgi:two-component system sensor histidine kinase/response regulator